MKPFDSTFWSGQLTREPTYASMEKKTYYQKGGMRGGTDSQQEPGQYGKGRGRGGRGGYNQQQYDNRPNYNNQQNVDGGNADDFQRNQYQGGTGKHHRGGNLGEAPSEEDFLKRSEADNLRKKLAEESKKVLEKAKSDKNTQQKIRLIVNVITPDNFERKFVELRGFMFGDRKLPHEEGYNVDVDKLAEGTLSDENMNIVVETIFRKAQNEKEYCTFYGDLCERIIRLEINFLGHEKVLVKNIKASQFRKSLLQHCRTSFDQFFTTETKEILESKEEENVLRFKQRLFGSNLILFA
jgi:hypothetical protein